MAYYDEEPKTWEDMLKKKFAKIKAGETEDLLDHDNRTTSFSISHDRIADAKKYSTDPDKAPQEILEEILRNDLGVDSLDIFNMVDYGAFTDDYKHFGADIPAYYYVYTVDSRHSSYGHDNCFVNLRALEYRMKFLDEKGVLDDYMSQYGNLVKFLAVADMYMLNDYKDRIDNWIRACAEDTMSLKGQKDTTKIIKRLNNIKMINRTFKESVAAIEAAFDTPSIDDILGDDEKKNDNEGMGPNE